jgi:hypothetical protein
VTRGEVVRAFGPWLVVDPGGAARGRWVVVDSTARPMAKVYGPAPRPECESWARLSWALLMTVAGQVEHP